HGNASVQCLLASGRSTVADYQRCFSRNCIARKEIGYANVRFRRSLKWSTCRCNNDPCMQWFQRFEYDGQQRGITRAPQRQVDDWPIVTELTPPRRWRK